MKRRTFIQTTAAAVSLNAFPHHLFAGSKQKLPSDHVLLGPMKVPVSRLAMGTGTNGVGGSSNQTRKLGYDGMVDLFKAAYDNGVIFWDSADQYGTHTYLRKALQSGIPRDKVRVV